MFHANLLFCMLAPVASSALCLFSGCHRSRPAMTSVTHMSYASRKASRQAAAGASERAYTEMRRELELHLQSSPPQNGRFVAVVTDEERLREALCQRASPQQVLDVMEQRWPHPAQRIHLVKQIAAAVGTDRLRDALRNIETRYGLAVPAPARPAEPSSVSVQPSLSTQPSLPPPSLPPPAPLAHPPEDTTTARRDIAVRYLSPRLTRSQWRSLASVLGMPIGFLDDVNRESSSNREAVERVLEKYFSTRRLHCGDQIGTLVRALRELHLNMTADELTDEMRW